MGYSYSFLDNHVYGADDVNAALGQLVSAGVGFYSGSTNLIEGMRQAQATYVESGIAADSCKAELVGEDTVLIHAGAAFFADGSSIRIDEDGVELPYTPGTAVYVYFRRNNPDNTICPVISTEAGSGDFVPVAEIAANGTVTDTRHFAVTKLAPNTANVYLKHAVPEKIFTSSMDTETPYYTIDAGSAWFQYIMITTQKGTGIVPVVFELAEGVKTNFVRPEQANTNGYHYIAFQKRGQYIDVYGKHTGSGGSAYYFDAIIF